MVVDADTVIDPLAMVVVSLYTPVAKVAMT